LKMRNKIILICMVGLLIAAVAISLSGLSAQHTGFRIIDFLVIFLMILSGNKSRNAQWKIQS
jgi:hypothetical protein